MKREMLALNHALMVEMIRGNGFSDGELLDLLKRGQVEKFEVFGEGIPDWRTLIKYYQNNTDKVENAVVNGYRITFLTKGALKGLLGIKFRLQEGVDFEDRGTSLDGIRLASTELTELRDLLAANWRIVEMAQSGDVCWVRIELSHKG